MSGSDFDFSQLETKSSDNKSTQQSKKPRKSRKKKSLPVGLFVAVGVILLGIVGCVILLFTQEKPEKPKNANGGLLTKRFSVDEMSPLEVDLSELVGGSNEWRFKISDGPGNAKVVDEVLFWTPTEDQGPREHTVVIDSFADGSTKVTTRTHLIVTVVEVDQPPVIEPVLPQIVDASQGVNLTIKASDPDKPQVSLSYELVGDELPGAQLDRRTGKLVWVPSEAQAKNRYTVRVAVTENKENGLASRIEIPVQFTNTQETDTQTDSLAKVQRLSGPEMTEPSPEPPKTLPTITEEQYKEYGEDKILTLYRDRKLFTTQYPVFREIYATRLEQKYEKEIRDALADDFDEAHAWFEDHSVIKEELYTAIDSQSDNVAAAVSVFNAIRKNFPEQVVSHAPLAIATAVVWDNDKGVYRYGGHQRRTHSVMPETLLDGVENFDYMLKAGDYMQGRGRFLPWEFLVHVVNHPTPFDERKWAVVNYVKKRPMFGKCYHDVPYDNEMLQTGSKVCRLDGKEYNLPNLREFGGVCAMQADFAARVGKSIGVPAAYVSGQGRFGGGHAWVMWVELMNVNAQGILFELKSHGRYRGDHYYVGNLKNPQTGRGMTDRELELQLQTVGIGPLNKRRADWLMDSFPTVAAAEQLNVVDRIDYLDRVLRISPLNTEAWRALAKMSRDGEITKQYKTMMIANLDSMFVRFAKFPDFTWTVFDDLIAFQDNAKQRDQWYARLVEMYEAAGRPDLACKARLRFSDYLEEQGKLQDSFTGLGFTVLKFPQEGRFVPPLLDRMNQIAPQIDGAEVELVKLYKSFLPQIQKKRINSPSKYCMNMYRRGIELFRQAGDNQSVAFWSSELAKLESNPSQL